MLTSLKPLLFFVLHPVETFQKYRVADLKFDITAGLTVAVILLPQAIAYALIIELPPEMGLYAAVIAAIVAALWGSSYHMQTGPTNAVSLLILSVILSMGLGPESPQFLPAIGLLAVMVGVFQIIMGVARLGILVNFVSDSVIVGFTGGAGILIAANQLRHLLGLNFSSTPSLVETLQNVYDHALASHLPSLAMGCGTILLILLLKRYLPKLPYLLASMVVASTLVAVFDLEQTGLHVIGELPRSLPPLAQLPLFDLELIGRLSTGALAIASIGLMGTVSIARSLANQTGQQLDSNQEFVGQGLANVAVGLFSGFAGAGSFARSAINHGANARTPLASLLSGIFVFMAMVVFAPLGAYIPRAALAGALIVIGFGMLDRAEMIRIWRGTRGDSLIMIATLLGTLLLDLQFAVLIGILISLVRYIIKTSIPVVTPVLPDDAFSRFIPREDKPQCPQLAIFDILGDLYFGAVNHVEQQIRQNLTDHPQQRFLLLRMRGVHHCDISGIHMLETLMRTYRERGGDLYLMRVQEPVLKFMISTGFETKLGSENFLPGDEAVPFLFYKILDPAICIYECEIRAFAECQNLPKQANIQLTIQEPPPTNEYIRTISPLNLWDLRQSDQSVLQVVDVREPREYQQGHIPDAQLIPLPQLLSKSVSLHPHRNIVLVCRSGRRSTRAATALQKHGFTDIKILQGGMLAWEDAGLMVAVSQIPEVDFA